MSKNKLKVLTVNVSDSSGGAARAAYRIHKAVMTAGVDGKFLVKNKYLADTSVIAVDSFDKKYPFSNIISYVQHKIKNKIQLARWRPYPNRDDVFLSDLRSSEIHGALQKIDFDILHLHWINLRFLDLRELRKINKPIVWTLHDCWAFTGICHYFYDCERYTQGCGKCPHLHSNNANDLSAKVWQQKKQIYQGFNMYIVTPSHWLADAARKSSLFSQFPVSVIPNPIDTEYFCPGNKAEACEELKLDVNKKYILFGAMNAVNDRNKGFVEFKKTIQYFEQHYNDGNTEILIFGSNEAPDMGLNHIAIKNLGMLHDKKLLAAYRAAHVMVVPSLSENLSNIIMESLACGTPVVAFNIGGNADMIDHMKNGYLAQSLDIEDLAKGVNYCLLNNADGALTEAAREKVVANFGIKTIGEHYIKLYKTLKTNI